jgi:hypothetical protein
MPSPSLSKAFFPPKNLLLEYLVPARQPTVLAESAKTREWT